MSADSLSIPTTQGDILVFGATAGVLGLQRLGAGSDGDVLTVDHSLGPALKYAPVSLQSPSPSAGIGYATGAGATVTQNTSRSTGVTINAICGQITGDNSSLGIGAQVEFVVTNSAVAATDVVVLSVASGPSALSSIFTVSGVAAGSFTIRISNVSMVNVDNGAPIINFAVIKAVTS